MHIKHPYSIDIISRMVEQRRRMTYEEQRAARERVTQRQPNSQQVPSRRVGASQAQASPERRPSASQMNTAQPTAQRKSPDQTDAAANASRPHAKRGAVSKRNGGATTAARPSILLIVIAVALVIAVVFIVRMCSAATPINVTVNGTSYELRGSKTMQTAIKASGLPINPGDFISLNGNVLEKSAGDPFAATVNDVETADPNFALRDGDTITLTDGKDIVEGYSSEEQSIPYGATTSGMGAVHKFERGSEGVLEVRTGEVSGEIVEKQKTSPVDTVCRKYNLNTGMNKVIAFTFDDGPSEEYTAAVLDILKENDAKATFFCIGTEVESYPNLVKREAEEGHQVCTHSYDHADPVGGTDIGLMPAAGQVDEIVHGMKTITDVLGGEASRVVRMPGGNLNDSTVSNLQDYIDYEIGWNIDTEDWTLPGEEAIYQAMISVQPGEIILCHDGGGDRSETVAALRRALPYLKSKGFTFATMDEILEYPASA